MNIFVVILVGVTFAAIGQVSWKLGLSQVGQLAAEIPSWFMPSPNASIEPRTVPRYVPVTE